MRRAAAPLIVMTLLLTPAACGSTAHTSDEKAVCNSFQRMVDELRAKHPREALAEMRQLQRLTGATDNQVISESGKQFSEGIDKQVSDAEVTPQQASEEGRRALSIGGAALSRIVGECARLGFKVDLPKYDPDGKRIPGS